MNALLVVPVACFAAFGIIKVRYVDRYHRLEADHHQLEAEHHRMEADHRQLETDHRQLTAEHSAFLEFAGGEMTAIERELTRTPASSAKHSNRMSPDSANTATIDNPASDSFSANNFHIEISTDNDSTQESSSGLSARRLSSNSIPSGTPCFIYRYSMPILLHNMANAGGSSCIGTTADGAQCKNRISETSRLAIGLILRRLANQASLPARQDLEELAGYALCKGVHGGRPHERQHCQVKDVAREWMSAYQRTAQKIPIPLK